MPSVKKRKPVQKRVQRWKRAERPLTTRELAFCLAFVVEPNGTAAYKKAVPGSSDSVAAVAASKLVRTDKIKAEIARLRAGAIKSNHLTLQEKRDFLAGVLRTPVGDIDHTSVYCQERTYTVGREDDSVKIKGCDKLRALELDSRLNGDLKAEGADATPVYATPAELVEVLRVQALTLWGREQDVREARAAVGRSLG